jgi:hypothetical protein
VSTEKLFGGYLGSIQVQGFLRKRSGSQALLRLMNKKTSGLMFTGIMLKSIFWRRG